MVYEISVSLPIVQHYAFLPSKQLSLTTYIHAFREMLKICCNELSNTITTT